MGKVGPLFISAVSVLVIGLWTTSVAAQTDASAGKVSIETTSIAAGIGFSWGNGKLNFNGKVYPFSVDGVTLLDVGFSKATASGEVYHLTEPAEFEGNYVAAEASVALGGGIGGLSLRNSNGVVMRLNSVATGARFQLGSSGMTVKLW